MTASRASEATDARQSIRLFLVAYRVFMISFFPIRNIFRRNYYYIRNSLFVSVAASRLHLQPSQAVKKNLTFVLVPRAHFSRRKPTVEQFVSSISSELLCHRFSPFVFFPRHFFLFEALVLLIGFHRSTQHITSDNMLHTLKMTIKYFYATDLLFEIFNSVYVHIL